MNTQTFRKLLLARWRAVLPPNDYVTATDAIEALWADAAAREAICWLRGTDERPNAHAAGRLLHGLPRPLHSRRHGPRRVWSIARQREDGDADVDPMKVIAERWVAMLGVARAFSADDALKALRADSEARRALQQLADDGALSTVRGAPTLASFERWLRSNRRKLRVYGNRLLLEHADLPEHVAGYTTRWRWQPLDEAAERSLEARRIRRRRQRGYRTEGLTTEDCSAALRDRWQELIGDREVLSVSALEVLWADAAAREAISAERSDSERPNSRAFGLLLARLARTGEPWLTMRRLCGMTYWRAA